MSDAAATPPRHQKGQYTGLDRVIRASKHSWDGFVRAYRDESAFRQEVWLAVILMPLAFALGRTWQDTALLIGSVVLVLITELLNSAVEAAVDRISLDWHDLTKKAKDIGSAAVLLALLLCLGIWAAALWSRFFTH
ncbi:diacylglycerol kinase [Leptothrix ochracea]|uniref:diacylglycerol kinase n=1 Tax=Leptothrix ochracea TaxID=735331 RepID=UPI0034E2A962